MNPIVFVVLLVTIPISYVYLFPVLHMWKLRRKWNDLKNTAEEVLVQIKDIDPTINQNEEWLKALDKKELNDKSVGKWLKEANLIILSAYQDELSEAERIRNFVLGIGWPEKYSTELILFKKDVREMIKRLRNSNQKE